jgi:hypothetical protein
MVKRSEPVIFLALFKLRLHTFKEGGAAHFKKLQKNR